MADYTPTEADEFERRAQKQRTKLENPFPWILRIRQRFVDAGGSPRAFDHCVESYAATSAERAVADERAKRPDREQIARALARVIDCTTAESPDLDDLHCDMADAVLALEPEAREVTDAAANTARRVLDTHYLIPADGPDPNPSQVHCHCGLKFAATSAGWKEFHLHGPRAALEAAGAASRA